MFIYVYRAFFCISAWPFSMSIRNRGALFKFLFPDPFSFIIFKEGTICKMTHSILKSPPFYFDQ